MNPVRIVTGTMAPLDRANVDTDQIIPQTFLKRIERTGYGEFLFHSWAHDEEGDPRPGFVLNRPEYRSATVLVAGDNFGCGSSREHAAWAIEDWGFRAVVTSSAADIFRNNAHNVGVLVIELPQGEVEYLLALAADPTAEVTIDLAGQSLTAPGIETTFSFEAAVRHRLLNGLDPVGVTLTHDDAIRHHHLQRPPWMPAVGRPAPASNIVVADEI